MDTPVEPIQLHHQRSRGVQVAAELHVVFGTGPVGLATMEDWPPVVGTFAW